MGVRRIELRAGAMIGRFRVAREIGRGGHGIVYEARDLFLGRNVALKTLWTPSLAGSQSDPTEAHLLSTVGSPHVAAIYDLLRLDDALVLVLELVEGPTLERRLLLETRIPIREVVALGMDLASGLVALHTVAIVHRDIKPGNLRLSRTGLLKILDLGAACRSGTSDALALDCEAVVGTIPYMAPEQLCGRADARSDIYSAGAVLYEMATGYRAFDAGPTGSNVGGCGRPAPPPRTFRRDLPSWRESAIVRSLHPDPDHRFQSAHDLLDALSSGFASTQSEQPLLHPARSPETLCASMPVNDLTLSSLETVRLA
jgi:serine/threonine protein kinase